MWDWGQCIGQGKPNLIPKNWGWGGSIKINFTILRYSREHPLLWLKHRRVCLFQTRSKEARWRNMEKERIVTEIQMMHVLYQLNTQTLTGGASYDPQQQRLPSDWVLNFLTSRYMTASRLDFALPRREQQEKQGSHQPYLVRLNRALECLLECFPPQRVVSDLCQVTSGALNFWCEHHSN